MSSRRKLVNDYVYDSTEQTATCCLGDVFFRKRRLTAANSDFYVKPKRPLDEDDVNGNNEDDTSGRLASSTERTSATTVAGVNLNSKYQGSSDDNSRGTRLAATPDNDSYSRAVNQAGPARPSSWHDSADPPPRYTPTRDEQPLQVGNDTPGAARGRSRQRPRAVSAGRMAKEHEMLQNMWLENHGRRQADQRVSRRSNSVGGSSRTVYVIDRASGTTYRRGRLLGKVLHCRRRRRVVPLFSVSQLKPSFASDEGGPCWPRCCNNRPAPFAVSRPDFGQRFSFK